MILTHSPRLILFTAFEYARRGILNPRPDHPVDRFYDTGEGSPSAATGLTPSLVRVDAPTRRAPFLLGRCVAFVFIFHATECMFFAALKSLADEASALSDQRNSLPLVVRWLSAYVVVRFALRAAHGLPEP